MQRYINLRWLYVFKW